MLQTSNKPNAKINTSREVQTTIQIIIILVKFLLMIVTTIEMN